MISNWVRDHRCRAGGGHEILFMLGTGLPLWSGRKGRPGRKAKAPANRQDPANAIARRMDTDCAPPARRSVTGLNTLQKID
jgi:hypothetical protein